MKSRLESHEFTSDGCTGWFDGNWHDYLDYIGVADNLADATLFECVSALSPVMAVIMVVGLRLFRPIYRLVFKR